jgi:hypothetical protein
MAGIMSDLIGYEAGRAELDRLLSDARTRIAAARGQPAEALQAVIRAATEELVDFTTRTEPSDIGDTNEFQTIQNLDRVADEARRGIIFGTIDEIIARIQDRASQLNQLSKQVGQVAKAANAQADRLKLVPIRTAVEAMSSTVEAFKQAKSALTQSNPDEAAIAERIGKLVSEFDALRGALSRL